MPTYRVDVSASHLVVKARSSIHDTTTKWDKLSGTIDADPDTLEETGAVASFSVDMAAFDAGDWLKNRKLKKDLKLGDYPTSTFELTGLRDVVRKDDGSFEAVGLGVLRYRNRELELEISGTGTMDAQGIRATGSFDMDIRDVDMEPPKILMFKVDPEVTVEITLVAKV